MPQHRERPASSLARGPAKTADIETARRDLGRAQRSAARESREAAARAQQQQQVPRRERRSAPEDRPRAR